MSLLLGPVGTKADAIMKGISKLYKDDPNAKPLVREVLSLNPVFAVNREARKNAVDIIVGDHSEFDSYEEFSRKLDLDNYFKNIGDL